MRSGSVPLVLLNTVRAAFDRAGRDGGRLHVPAPVVASREPPLEKAVKDDELIARTHLLNSKFRDAGLPIDPLVWDDGAREESEPSRCQSVRPNRLRSQPTSIDPHSPPGAEKRSSRSAISLFLIHSIISATICDSDQTGSQPNALRAFAQSEM